MKPLRRYTHWPQVDRTSKSCFKSFTVFPPIRDSLAPLPAKKRLNDKNFQTNNSTNLLILLT